MQHDVFERKTFLSLDDDYSYLDIKEIMSDMITDDIYSYFVGRKENTIIIKVVTSAISEFNTINRNEAIENISNSIVDYIMSLSQNKCVCFGQPPLDLIVELYQPMIAKMATRLNLQWKQFEYEDLVAMGNLVMVQLYKKGYYLNKYLIKTALNNEVLMQCRDFKDRPLIVSIYDKVNNDFKMDADELNYGDVVEDESYKEKEEQEDLQDLEKYIFEQVKDIIIEKIGQRQWDQLWRDYGKGHTTGQSQAAMRRIKAYFEELGLTRQNFINGYRR